MAAYYNEVDPKAAAWLRYLIAEGLIADGEVDERSIEEVEPDDVRGFVQCHWFAGIGGWSYALRLAGWPDDRHAWTGSCPCQRFSSASRGRAAAADMWPAFRRLVVAGRPRILIGEQVAAARDWFDGVCDDLEAVGYAVGAAVLPACGVGLDHARPRLFFVGHADRHGESGVPVDEEVARLQRTHRDAGRVAAPHGIPDGMAQLAGFGNAIVAELGAEFVGAYMDIDRESRLTSLLAERTGTTETTKSPHP